MHLLLIAETNSISMREIDFFREVLGESRISHFLVFTAISNTFFFTPLPCVHYLMVHFTMAGHHPRTPGTPHGGNAATFDQHIIAAVTENRTREVIYLILLLQVIF